MTEKILKIGFYLLFGLTPLIFTSFNQELFEYNKMMFVYLMTTVIVGAWVIKMINSNKLIFKKTPLDLPLGLFLMSQILSTIFSIDPHTSFWGYYSRSNGGLLSVISYVLLYYAFVSNFVKEDVVKFLKAALFGGLLVSLYAIPEHFGVSPSCIILTHEFSASCWVQDVQARVFGTLGQPNWLAAYLAMLIFPAIYFYINAKSQLSKTCYLLLVTCYYLAFTFTYSRGATLGIIAGLGVFIISQFISAFQLRVVNPQSRRFGVKLNFTSFRPLAIIILIFITINLFFGSALTDFKILKEPAIHSRPDLLKQSLLSGTQLENGGTESGAIRLIVWKGALEIFKAYPIFGSGVETFAYAYYQFRPAEHNLVSEWDFLYNKAHNEYLNYLATTGAFGFITYLAIILTFLVWSIWYVVYREDKSQYTAYNILTTALLASYISYLIQDFFLFSVVIVSLFFYLFPAMAFLYADSVSAIPEKNFLVKLINNLLNLINRKKFIKICTQGLIIIIVLVSVYKLSSFWEADTYFKQGSDYNDAGNPGRAYNYLVEAVRLNPNEPLYLSELGHAAGSSALALSSEDATTAGQLKDDSIFFTDTALAISPHNTTIIRTAIRTFFELTLLDPKLQEKTLEIVNRGIALSPTDPKLYHNKGIILNQFKRLKEATASLQLAIGLKPNYIDAIKSLADVYFKAGMMKQAQEQFEAALKLTPGDPELIKQIEETKK